MRPGYLEVTRVPFLYPHFTDGETEVQRGHGDGPSFELRCGDVRTRPGLVA